ncbi:SMP-30/gluconolactonase/LRE family protein [Agrobacterium vitis]|uniref:SMP-30/gluconolactonase/LRE family protein n=1 Tax=Agrobacterium vitis TaxID=373 RepID=A0AAE5AX70_AGRVI|nr:SMP-30/gluconolactonase/LRE family protein [Agrobacterium vitis]MCF1500255.1 SMP-30/gluconolactonase/LRE family protein [Allorhizobium sp. Av2]MCM2441682.1 SMP-30/gluconolactonase/LRE family protein [Agrobacterium vitis]MUZ58930.1 SMP-30/gluconolactonase/LRE family protein [Agrobacterium vitis]MVA68036.1 SMP-30/gluconolactonase/LRE family protein [Agrobacterium vitis]MVA88702.1 SMP-30/gluconolactonase/LRE family protein [Agrobacterium vitis]
MSFFEISDPAFGRFVMGNAPVKQLATGFDWVEGPVWFGDLDCLLFSDIPNNRILRWTPDGSLTTFRAPSNFANGHTRDRQGRLVSCEHGTRRVTRTEYDGTITVIADSFEGKRLNSPNDVIVASDGAIWFSDPHYGIATDYEGTKSEQELPCNVYRVDPSGAISAVLTDFNCPNGLAFSPDEKRLYVADTGRMHSQDPQHIRVFDVDDGWKLTGGDVFHVIDKGCADGMRLDSDGYLWSSAADGVHCIAPDGHLMGKILVPETVSNLCFGGRGKHRLFITATTSLYAISLNRNGAA